jgi:ribose transport system substrate-binding protein
MSKPLRVDLLWCSGALALALMTAACGTDAKTSSGGSSEKLGAAAAASASAKPGDCGSVPTTRGFKDSTGVVEGLGDEIASYYNGYDTPVQGSAWADWKPTKFSGFKVGVMFGPLFNGNQNDLYNGLVSGLEASPIVSEVVKTNTTGIEPSEFLQKYQSVLQKGVDLMVYQAPPNAAAMIPVVAKAAKAGVPSVSINGQTDSPYVVNVTPNAYLFGARGGAYLMRLLGGSGNVLEVEGIPGVGINDQNKSGFKDALAMCPDVKVVGTVSGGFADGAAQTAVLQFLSSHPQPLDGAWEAGAMANGVIGAFGKLKRDVPPLASSSTSVGYLAYLAANPEYAGVANQVSGWAEGQATAYTATKMLAGNGAKVNSIVLPAEDLYAFNVAAWEPGTDTKSAAAPKGPKSLVADSHTYVDNFFAR